MSTQLSVAQELFCVEYASTQDPIESYKKAFAITNLPDEKAEKYAFDLLDDSAVKQKIIQLTNSLAPKEILSKQRVLEELSQMARTSLFPVDRIRALDLLGKYYKLFDQKDNSQKTYIGENKVFQIVYMSPDHKTLTTLSPLRKTPRPEIVDITASPAAPSTTPETISSLEKDLDDLCG